eukprot:m.169299 g.169299  ORF g.169299 m.169299 type:complete len:339 (+) comp38981_c0_seq5:3-1019(+)
MDSVAESLKTLRFEASLDPEEISRATSLRKRAHASSTSICALSAVFCNALNETRQWIRENLESETDVHSRKGVSVGIIGCGRIGQQIVKCLLAYGRCEASDISISTRRPEALHHLIDLGIDVGFDNARVARSVHLLFIACLPSQLFQVAKSIAGSIHFSTLVYSVVGGASLVKTCQLLSFRNIASPDPELLPLDRAAEYPPNPGLDVVDSLKQAELCSLLCPQSDSSLRLIKMESDWQVGLVLSCLNVCTQCQLTAQDSFRCLNAVFFPSLLSLADQISMADIRMTRSSGDEKRLLPFWTLLSAVAKQPKLKAKLASPAMRGLFLKKFLEIFKWPKLL